MCNEVKCKKLCVEKSRKAWKQLIKDSAKKTGKRENSTVLLKNYYITYFYLLLSIIVHEKLLVLKLLKL